MDSFELEVDAVRAGMRLDELLGLPRRTLRHLEGAGRVRVDGRALLEGSPRLGLGSRVELLGPAAAPALLAETIPIPILLETEALFFIDKRGVLRDVIVSDINRRPDLELIVRAMEKMNKK